MVPDPKPHRELTAVFNPSPDALQFRYNSMFFTLQPDDLTLLPTGAVGPMLVQLGSFGVIDIPQGIPRERFDQIVATSREVWYANAHRRAEDLIVASSQKNAPRVAAGLDPIEDPEVVKAREWLAQSKNPAEEKIS